MNVLFIGGTGIISSACARHALARINDARQEFVEHRRLLHASQSRRVGRGNVDRDIARDWREALEQGHIVDNAIGRILVGAGIDVH